MSPVHASPRRFTRPCYVRRREPRPASVAPSNGAGAGAHRDGSNARDHATRLRPPTRSIRPDRAFRFPAQGACEAAAAESHDSLRGAFKRGRCGRAPRRIKRPRSCHAAPPTHLPRPSRSSLQISGPRGPRGGRPPRGGCTVHWPALALPTVRFSVEPAIRAVPPARSIPLDSRSLT